MSVRQTLAIAVLAAAIGGLLVPALAETAESAPNQGMNMDMGHSMGHGMMGHGPMAGGMMQSGCAGMMQSMSGGDGRPNSQWPAHRPGGGAMVN